MAGVKNSDIKQIFDFMGDFWGMVKDFWIPEDTDVYWQGLKERSDKLVMKYPEIRFVEIMIMALEDYLEEKQTGKKVCRRYDRPKDD